MVGARLTPARSPTGGVDPFARGTLRAGANPAPTINVNHLSLRTIPTIMVALVDHCYRVSHPVAVVVAVEAKRADLTAYCPNRAACSGQQA